MTSTLSRSTSSCTLVLVPAGLPPVSAEKNSTLRPAIMLFFSFRIVEDALLHLDAALGERAGLDGEQAELEGRGLGVDRGCFERGHADAGGQHPLEYGSAFDRHWHSLPW